MKIAILSDTHNLLRPEVVSHLQGSDYILHAGDISRQEILDRLEEIAPVKVVRGNNDKEWAEHLPDFLDFELAGLRLYMTHRKKDLPQDLSHYDLAVIGHSHQYKETWLTCSDGKQVLILNPGSCGLRRFHQEITMAQLMVNGDGWKAERIEIPREHRAREYREVKVPDSDLKSVINAVVSETRKRKTVEEISCKYKLDPSLVERIVRLYVTHPGVDADGIMTKMGL